MKPYIALAPMEGLTTYVYRNAVNKYYGGIDEFYSPFITSRELSFKELSDISTDNNKELKLIPQILTNNPDTFLTIAATLKDLGYDEVNLNLGCPSGTMVAKNRGAGQLKDPDKLKEFLDTIYASSPVKISIKTRIGMYSVGEWEDILNVYREFPVSKLIIHPRLQREFYEGTVHFDTYEKAMETVNFPVMYNGDIRCIDHISNVLNKCPETSGIMIGRGLLANPSFARLIKEGECNTDLSVFKAFHNEILDSYTEYMSGDKPVLFRMKELWTYMHTFVDLSDKQMKQIRKCNSVSEYKSIVRSILS